MTPQVMGIDLAAACSGIAMPRGTTHVIREPKARGKKRCLLDDLDRIDHVEEHVAGLLAHYAVDLAVIEDYAAGIKSAAAHRLAEIGGVVRLACHRAGVPIALVNVMHLKIYATGNGHAEKRDMAIAAYKRWNSAEFATDDECDAAWLRSMGMRRLGHPLEDLPQTHLAAMGKVAWPEVAEREAPC
ncbi:crossover junction endodeoxyribonuclease RuvC [Actinomadura rudentiformis]|uniref:Crossover junction endodeoxyribonuclease RuvC n=1 Tax=Actinomadura rudentiformis TaxID=359158 RepID=A0A6H9YQ97_9ACTN|nr:crossover junction endodeoxyribonuclease RuvC [Actinomadura rudentiformis]KAB2347308.1 crossover junction endodeoxyribonuclease RuvC [Actinomadura rudentiformis]